MTFEEACRIIQYIPSIDEVDDLEFAETVETVYNLLGRDEKKTLTWFNLENYCFGRTSPTVLIKQGRFSKVRQFVIACKEST